MEIARSERLALRRVELGDRDEIVAMYEMGRSVERWSPPLRPDMSLEQMVEGWVAEDPARHLRLVTEPLDGTARPRLANVIALTDMVRGVFQNAYIAWRTHPALLRQGYCAEAVSLALGYALAENGLGLHRVQAAILPDNVGSCRVAQKCGFRLEGVAQRYLLIREQWRDHLIFAITAEEWPVRRIT
jgi:ribosomal-protein-alanine N-acetyltransferase